MDENVDVRWKQRFSNYNKALSKLNRAVSIINPDTLDFNDIDDVDELKLEGLIQRFEYTHELAWHVMSDYAKYQGEQEIKGSRDAIRYGLKNGLIDDEIWMRTIIDRNRTSHTYDEAIAQEIIKDILYIYHALFLKLEKRMFELYTL